MPSTSADTKLRLQNVSLPSLAAAEAALLALSPTDGGQGSHTIEHVRDVLAALGNPQDAQPAVHIAGTSGKTSTAYYTAALLQAAGKRVGLLTSPHVHGLNERVQINFVPLPEREFCDELALFLRVLQQQGVQLGYAATMYAFAYWEFARKQVDYVVVEVGVGGLLDPTNVITRADKVCIITDIGFDHMNVLGHTLGEIAAQKAGIIGYQQQVFCYRQAPQVMRPIMAVAKRQQADVHVVQPPAAVDASTALPLFQQRNSFLAVQAVQALLRRQGHTRLTPTQIRTALQVVVPGRMQLIPHGSQTIIIDGAHNLQKFQTLVQSIQARYPGQPVAAVIASVDSANRDTGALFQALRPLRAHCMCAPLPPHTGYASRSVVDMQAAASAAGLTHEPAASYQAAIHGLLARSEPILLICGTLYAVAVAEQLVYAAR